MTTHDKPLPADQTHTARARQSTGAPLRRDAPPDNDVRSQRPAAAPLFVGRRRELQQLTRLFERTRAGQQACGFLIGGPGVGKSALLEAFARRLEKHEPAPLVLRSTCYPYRAAPYRSLDGVVSGIARALQGMDEEACVALLPERAGVLPVALPALGSVPAIATRMERRAPDQLALRSLMFSAWRGLLSRMARARPVVLLIDDLHFADLDSVALLCELLRPPAPPPLLLLGTSRLHESDRLDTRRTLQRLMGPPGGERQLRLYPLTHRDGRELAARLVPADPGLAGQLADQSSGNALFLKLAAPQPAVASNTTGLEALVLRTLEALPADARHLLETCCAAGQPLPRGALTGACGLASTGAARPLEVLRDGSLIVETAPPSGEPQVAAHQAVREVLLAHLDEARARTLHERIAHQLEAIQHPDREAIGRHWAAAGIADRAAECAVSAGDQAAEALAFVKAARLYQWSIQLRGAADAPTPLLIKLAECLARAGEPSGAADALLRASADEPPARALELERRAMELLMQGGRRDEALRLAGQLLAKLGLELPQTQAQKLRLLMWNTLRRKWHRERFEPREANEVPYHQLMTIDVLWSLITQLGPSDFFLVAALQSQHYLLALEAREPGRVAEAMCMDVFGLFFTGKADQVPTRLAQAASYADRCPRAEVRAMLHHTRGIAYHLAGDYSAGMESLEAASALLSDECVGQQWMVDMVQTPLLISLWATGQVDQLAQRLPLALREAEERGSPYARSQLLLSCAFVYHLMHDRPDLAREAIARGLRIGGSGSAGTMTAAHSSLHVDCYEGSPFLRTEQQIRLERLRRDGALRTGRGAWLVASCGLAAVAAARRTPAGREQLLRFAARCARDAARCSEPRTHTGRICGLLDAALLDLGGRRQQALRRYRALASACEAHGERLGAAAAQLRCAQLDGDGSDEDVRQRVEADLAERGVDKPLRFLHSLLPGVFALRP